MLAQMESIKLKISKEFGPTPGPRYKNEGDFSGEKFREDILSPLIKQAIREGKRLIVDLDGTAGYGTSFLEEAFGGLIREERMDVSKVISTLAYVSQEEDYLIDDIKEYIEDAASQRQQA